MKSISREEKLQNILEVSRKFSHIQDLDVLLEHLLTEARKIVNADAGSIYIVKGKKLHIKYAQNETVSSRTPNGKLPYIYYSFPIDEKSMAGYVALTGKELNIPDAYSLSPDLPFSFNRQSDIENFYHSQSVFTMPLKTANGKVLGILQIINACDENKKIIAFDKDAELFLFQLAANAAQILENAYLADEMVYRMLLMSAFRDPKETYPHVERVALISVEIYDRWAHNHAVPEAERNLFRDRLRIASKFHDIGKVGISDIILKKTQPRLDCHERAMMKTHTCIGAKMFLNGFSDSDAMAFEVALHHHERWDGGADGYPGKVDFSKFVVGEPLPEFELMKGEEIPLSARIVSVADVFDALTHRRYYKDSWKTEEALAAIADDSGRRFDPDVVQAFMEVKEQILSILAQHPDDEEFSL